MQHGSAPAALLARAVEREIGDRDGEWSFVNADLTVWCHRYASGEWIALDSQTAIAATGVGCSHSALFDTTGPLGWSAQSLLLDRRGT